LLGTSEQMRLLSSPSQNLAAVFRLPGRRVSHGHSGWVRNRSGTTPPNHNAAPPFPHDESLLHRFQYPAQRFTIWTRPDPRFHRESLPNPYLRALPAHAGLPDIRAIFLVAIPAPQTDSSLCRNRAILRPAFARLPEIHAMPFTIITYSIFTQPSFLPPKRAWSQFGNMREAFRQTAHPLRLLHALRPSPPTPSTSTPPPMECTACLHGFMTATDCVPCGHASLRVDTRRCFFHTAPPTRTSVLRMFIVHIVTQRSPSPNASRRMDRQAMLNEAGGWRTPRKPREPSHGFSP
jgi:hypothetical protein